MHQRTKLTKGALGCFAVAALAAVQAGGSAPTPIYELYRRSLDLPPALITIIFAVYPLSLLLALLTTGSLSDHVGRVPVILGAMALSALSMIAFMTAHGFAGLVLARVLQGVATGAGASALGAALLDVSPRQGALVNSATAFSGTTLGALLSSALVTFAPFPTHLIFALLLAAFALLAVAAFVMPETSPPRPGERHSLRPRIELPAQARGAFVKVSPVNVAGWALGGFYLSLMPALFRLATGASSPMLGGAVVALLTFAGALAIVALRDAPARIILIGGSLALATGTAATVVGVRTSSVPILALGTLLAGAGFGASFFGSARTVLPLAQPHERAGLLAAFYVESYIAFSVPAVLISLLVPRMGLVSCTYMYAGFVIVLALASFAATAMGGARRIS